MIIIININININFFYLFLFLFLFLFLLLLLLLSLLLLLLLLLLRFIVLAYSLLPYAGAGRSSGYLDPDSFVPLVPLASDLRPQASSILYLFTADSGAWTMSSSI
jgi:hypothetical protein